MDVPISINRENGVLQFLLEKEGPSSAGGCLLVRNICQYATYQLLCKEMWQEFYRLHSSVRAKQEHASLLQDIREFDHVRLDLEENGNSVELVLLKEQASVGRSIGQIDSVISQALSTLGALVFQHSTFGGIIALDSSSIALDIQNVVRPVNQILASIKWRKSMDTIILSLVVSVCIFLIFIYWD